MRAGGQQMRRQPRSRPGPRSRVACSPRDYVTHLDDEGRVLLRSFMFTKRKGPSCPPPPTPTRARSTIFFFSVLPATPPVAWTQAV